MELLDQKSVLAEFARVLKKEGLLWVTFQALSDHCNPTAHQNILGISREKLLENLKESSFEITGDGAHLELCEAAFYTPSPLQDGTLLPVPYWLVNARKL